MSRKEGENYCIVAWYLGYIAYVQTVSAANSGQILVLCHIALISFQARRAFTHITCCSVSKMSTWSRQSQL